MFSLGAKVSMGHAYYFIYYLLILNRSSFNLVLIQSFFGKHHSVPRQEEMLSIWVLCHLSGLPLFSKQHLAYV